MSDGMGSMPLGGWKDDRHYAVMFTVKGIVREYFLGWTDSPDGGAYINIIHARPGWTLSRIVDRRRIPAMMTTYTVHGCGDATWCAGNLVCRGCCNMAPNR
jgi:hypothetical protein